MSACVETVNALDSWGYGKCCVRRFGKTIWSTHVVSWIDANGRLPADGLYVCHHCDNPSCVRPEHLYEGTPAQNTADQISRGRFVNVLAQRNTDKTCCPYGHPLDGLKKDGSRYCKECDRQRARRNRALKREQVSDD